MTTEQQAFIDKLTPVSLALAGWTERRFEAGWNVADVKAVLRDAMVAVETERA